MKWGKTKDVNTVSAGNTVPTGASVHVHLLFRTGKNTDRTSEFRLFRPVNGYRAETRNANLSKPRKPSRKKEKNERKMQKVTDEHSGFLNLQNRKFHFWERQRGRVNERPNLWKRDFVVTDFLWNWGRHRQRSGERKRQKLRSGLGRQSKGLEMSLLDWLENCIKFLGNHNFSGKWVGFFHYLFKLLLI